MEAVQLPPRFAVAGTGYVGLSLACLLASVGDVRALDVMPEKVEKINSGISPIADAEIEKVLASRPATLKATLDADFAFADRDFIVIATPTNYDPDRNTFDTSSIETVLDEVKASDSTVTVVIKSTIPVGYTERISGQYPDIDILFSPEFLREGHALADNLHPSRIVVGIPNTAGADKRARLNKAAHVFAESLKSGASAEIRDAIPVLTEAEAIKLFSNTYLALRVSYFNELDTYAESNGLDASQIIRGSPSIRALVTSTTTQALGTAATVSPRTRSSCSPTTVMCLRTSFEPPSSQTRPARTSSPERYSTDTPNAWASIVS